MRNAVEAILRKAGEEILRPARLTIEKKEGHANFVTDMDKRLEEELMTELGKLCPEASFVGEEKENEALTEKPTWVIDPIDGTTNFIHGYCCSGISVALLIDRSPVLGCIYQPFLKDMFSAERGKGAFLNGEPMHVSENPMEKALIGFGTSPYQPALGRPSLEAALVFLGRAVDIRRSGSAAIDLAYVASGRQDVFFELNLKPWDVAAGSLMVQEAGGVFTMPLQKELNYDVSTTILASNAVCAKEAHELLTKALSEHGITQQRIDELSK